MSAKVRRSGVIAKKVGMSRLFTDDGRHIPVTVLHLDQCQVISHKTAERDGYNAVQLGAGNAKPGRVSKAVRGHFAKSNVVPKRKVVEFRVEPGMMVDVGAEFSAAHFVVGQRVDVTGISVGKGFAGAMKRHNFAGLRASHGVSVSHRSHGSTGNNQDPGRVFKNKKMAGHMGAVQVTTQNLTVVNIDEDKNLVFIEGAVPGHKGSWITVRDSIKFDCPSDAPVPAGLLALKEAVVSQVAQSSEVSSAPVDAGDVPAGDE